MAAGTGMDAMHYSLQPRSSPASRADVIRPCPHSHIYKTEQLVKFLLLDRAKGRRYGCGVCAGGLS